MLRYYYRKQPALVLVSVVFLMLTGCGANNANRGNISGAVKLDGKPLEQGSILFAPMEGTHGTATGGTIENGRYKFSGEEGPAIGWNRVEIQAMRKTGKKIPKPFAPPGQTVDELVEAVSPRFNSESSLKVEVKRGENTADFEVSSP
jgi:hypothetical protein